MNWLTKTFPLFICWIKKYWTEIIVLSCCIICFVSLKYYFNQFGKNGLSDNTSNWGTFGDYVGGVLGTILSFFSVVLIYATYKNQVASSLLQQFETTFFNLLNNQREILKSLSGHINVDIIFDDLEPRHADDYISGVAGEIYDRFDGNKIIYKDSSGKIIPNIADTKEENEKIVDEVYLRIYKGKESELGHYFRHLYHIVKYVHESNISNKKKYIDIIQAQMSDDELYVTLYNCIAEYGRQKFLPLLDTYSFFENVSGRGEIFKIHCKQFYPKTKFKLLYGDE